MSADRVDNVGEMQPQSPDSSSVLLLPQEFCHRRKGEETQESVCENVSMLPILSLNSSSHFVLLLCVKFIIQGVTVSAHVQVFCECLHATDFMLVLSIMR